MPVSASMPRRIAARIPLMILVAAAVAVSGCTSSAATPAATSPASSAVAVSPTQAAVSPAAAEAKPSPSPSPRPSVGSQTSPTATITFHELVLETGAAPQTFTFGSDGFGTVSVGVVATTSQSSTKLCVAADGAAARCSVGVAPAFTNEVTATGHSTWTVTLASADESSPTVDLALSWPADKASVSLAGGRFQGSPNPDALRSLSASFTARAAGLATLDASWTPGSAPTGVTLSKEATAAATIVDLVTFAAAAALSPAYSHQVAAGTTYRITLMNQGSNGPRTTLAATISFP